MADGFDVVAVVVEHKCAVVLLVIVRPHARGAVVGSAGGEAGRVECVDGLAVACPEGNVGRRAGLVAARVDPEVGAALVRGVADDLVVSQAAQTR